MSNTEQMVSVPRDLAEIFDRANSPPPLWAVEKLRALLSRQVSQHQGEPVAFYREFVDGRQYCEKPFTNDWTPLYTHPAPVQQGDPKWRDMSSAPRDGTLLRLLVAFEENSTEDNQEAATIGANNFENDGEDTWQLAGWCWTHDHFTSGKGDPVGWLPMLDTPHADAAEVERLRADNDRIRLQAGGMQMEIDDQRTKLADQGALLRDRFASVRKLAEQACGRPKDSPEYRSFIEAINPTMLLDLTALSTSAEPSERPGCFVGADQATYPSERKPSAPVERDERADFEADQLSKGFAIDLLPGTVATYMIPAVRFAWAGWQARADLERKP